MRKILCIVMILSLLLFLGCKAEVPAEEEEEVTEEDVEEAVEEEPEAEEEEEEAVEEEPEAEEEPETVEEIEDLDFNDESEEEDLFGDVI